MVVYDDTTAEPVRIFDSGAVFADPATFGEFRLSYRTGDIVMPRIDATEPLALELTDFCSAVVDGSPLRSTPQLGLDVVRTVEAVERSLLAGGAPVRLGDEDHDQDFEPLPVRVAAREEVVLQSLSSPESVQAMAEDAVSTALLGSLPAGADA